VDFLALVQTVGLPWAVAFTVAALLSRVIVVMWKDSNRRTEAQIQDLKEQVTEIREDRDYHRERLYQVLGLTEPAMEAVRELVGGRRSGAKR
jgi:membrane protein implicated in regulation of membrane protease activity